MMFSNIYYTFKEIGLLSFMRTLFFNVKYFGYSKGLSFPVFISKNVCFNKLEGNIEIIQPKRGLVKIGFGNVGIFDKKYDRTVLEFCDKSTIIFIGSANIGHGSKISVQSNAKLIFGDNFCITANSSIVCSKEICFGSNCLLSWDILIMDSDLHNIYDLHRNVINEPNSIIVCNNVWIGAKTTILKGVTINSDNIIGASSLVTKDFLESNTIIAGSPAQSIKTNITWMPDVKNNETICKELKNI
jgi:acetyltransferase-like isoleucine patch superfamily enzyme